MSKKIIPLGIAMIFLCSVGGYLWYNSTQYKEMLASEEYASKTQLTVNEQVMDVGGKKAEEVYNEYMTLVNDNYTLKIDADGNIKEFPISDMYKHSITEDDFKKLTQEISFIDYIKKSSNELKLEDTYTYIGDAQTLYDKYINEEFSKKLTLTLQNKNYDIDVSKYYTHGITVSDIETELKSGIYEGDMIVKDELTYNEEATDVLTEFFETTQYEYTASTDAYFDKETLTIVQELQGNEIDIEKANEGLNNALINEEESINLDESKYIKLVTKTAAEMQEDYKDVLELTKWKVSYSVADYSIEMKDYMDSVTINEDGTYKIDYSFLNQAVFGLSKQVDKIGESVTFESTNDGKITVDGGTYGQMMSNKEEIAYLKEKIASLESETDREPKWKVEPRHVEDPTTYVEIDISDQHLWYYENNELVLDSKCVTGKKGVHDTPTGAYYVSEKVPGKYLVGEDYKTWVDKWMRLTNSGIGLHDAPWQPWFGGTRYKTNGSHGCINLPSSFADELYDEIAIHTLVIIHK